MAERTIERDEPVMDEQGEALRRAVDRAERAEAELAKLKAKGGSKGKVDSDDASTARAAKGGSQQGSAKHHLVEPGSLDHSKQAAADTPEGHPVGEPETHGIEALREDSMMAHLLDALDRGEDIGHYGRLVFAMVGRHFLTDDEVLAELTKDKDFSEDEARQMLMQVEGRDYNPPRRDRILEWQAEQEFPIIPNADDPDCGNVYKSLRFSKATYNHIGHYQEEKAAS
jgi:hypothetical protein